LFSFSCVTFQQIHNPETNKLTCFDKQFGKQLNPEKVLEMFNLFIGKYVNSNHRLDIIKQYLNILNSLKDWFENDNINNWKFIASSLLFVHSTNINDLKVNLKMIDFAHVFPNQSSDNTVKLKDDNYIFGLNKLIEQFQKLKKI